MDSEKREDNELTVDEEADETTEAKSGDRFQAAVAILIALVSVISAVVVWRASMAAGSGSAVDHRGLVDTVKYEAACAQTVAMLYQEADYVTQHALYQARVDTLQAQDSAAASTEAEWVSQIVVNLALFTPMTTDSDYQTAGGGVDLDKRLDDIRAADPDLRDMDPQQQFTDADQYYTEAQVLISFVIVFAVALFFLTLAEITRHKIRVGLAAIGTVIFLIGLSGVVIAEAYFVVSRLIAT
jgi:hypothetical protein